MQTVRVVDSHTGGEPTRLVLEGGPDLGGGPLAERLQRFRDHFDASRSAIVNEPRGSDPLVGALLVKPHRGDCGLGVIFFNNVGYLGMCGHGTIGLIASLKHLGELAPGAVKIDTPVGAIEANLSVDGGISVDNVVSYRAAQRVAVEVPGIGKVTGDVAWGGNWFFLISDHGQSIDLPHVDALTDFTWRVRAAINAQGYPLVDHIELFAPANVHGAHSRNFVLCPGKAYDRSPCGTGTSAKMACLWADGLLEPGQPYRQQSIVGSVFEGYVEERDGQLWPFIRGSAFVTAEGRLVLDESDPFRWGIRP